MVRAAEAGRCAAAAGKDGGVVPAHLQSRGGHQAAWVIACIALTAYAVHAVQCICRQAVALG